MTDPLSPLLVNVAGMYVSGTDKLPEFAHYHDDGCDIAPRCLACPLPACRYDMPPKRAGAMMRENQLRGILAEGYSLDEAAEIMGVTRRTIFRLKLFKATGSVG